MAVLGVFFLWKDQLKQKLGVCVNQSIVWMVIWAMLFSLICYTTTVVNETDTKDYTTYFISMTVWFCGAYASYSMIKYAHNKESVEIIGKYIVALCVVQGILSFLFYVYPAVYQFFSQFFEINQATQKSGTRLFGLGSSADTGGIRYAISLVFLAYLMCRFQITVKEKYLYSVCFFILLIFGNMTARTTTVGAILGLIFLIMKADWTKFNAFSTQPLNVLLISLLLCFPFLLIFNQFFPQTKDLYEFAFEGFMNFSETGKWSTSSTNILLEMWSIWPDNLKTWLIGDGLLLNPNDPTLYYMGTDVGYIRFIFFCGLPGFISFVLFFICLYKILNKRMPWHSDLFMLLLFLAFLIWIKVTTDIFFIFALLLCVNSQEERRSRIV